MNLQIFLPTDIFLEKDVSKITLEDESGFRTILPRHIDFVTALVPGILTIFADSQEEFLAVDKGILVKQGASITVSTRNAVGGADLGTLQKMVEEQYRHISDRERNARNAIVRLESDFARKMLEFKR